MPRTLRSTPGKIVIAARMAVGEAFATAEISVGDDGSGMTPDVRGEGE